MQYPIGFLTFLALSTAGSLTYTPPAQAQDIPALTASDLNALTHTTVHPATTIQGAQLTLSVESDDGLDFKRDGHPHLVFRLANYGDTPVNPGTRVLVKLPESITCDDFKDDDSVTLIACEDEPLPDHPQTLLSGSYRLYELKASIPAAQGTTPGTRSFTTEIRLPSNPMAGTIYQVESGIVGYTYQSADTNSQVTVIPQGNRFCNPNRADVDDACAIDTANAIYLDAEFDHTDQDDHRLVIRADDPSRGHAWADINLRIRDVRLMVNVSGPNRRMPGLILPGQQGNVQLIVSPPSGPSQGITHLVGSAIDGHTTLELLISGVSTEHHDDQDQRFLATDASIKEAFVRRFGTHINADGITIRPEGEDRYRITVPFVQMPASGGPVQLNNVFTATPGADISVEATFTYKPVTLVHRDTPEQPSRLNQPPLTTVQPHHVRATGSLRKQVPNVTVSTALTPDSATVATPGSTLTYQTVIRNTSGQPAHATQITHRLPEGFVLLPQMRTASSTNPRMPQFNGTQSWSLTPERHVATWGDERLTIPAGAVITLTYSVQAPQDFSQHPSPVIEVEATYNSSVGAVRGAMQGHHSAHAPIVTGDIAATARLEAPSQPGRALTSIQHGEPLTLRTQITLPPGATVANLANYYAITGATVDASTAQVQVECPEPITCSSNPTLLPGEPNRLGLVIADKPITNTSSTPVVIDVEIRDVRVTGGAGPLHVAGTVQRGGQLPERTSDMATASSVPVSGIAPVDVQPAPVAPQPAPDQPPVDQDAEAIPEGPGSPGVQGPGDQDAGASPEGPESPGTQQPEDQDNPRQDDQPLEHPDGADQPDSSAPPTGQPPTHEHQNPDTPEDAHDRNRDHDADMQDGQPPRTPETEPDVPPVTNPDMPPAPGGETPGEQAQPLDPAQPNDQAAPIDSNVPPPPVLDPDPEVDPVPRPDPAPEVDPVPVPDPAPAPNPAPVPDPGPEVDPVPAPGPQPERDPDPVPPGDPNVPQPPRQADNPGNTDGPKEHPDTHDVPEEAEHAKPAPVPAPNPPVPAPRPYGDRPAWIPQPPAQPAQPAPVVRYVAGKDVPVETRAQHWVDSVFGAGEQADTVLIGRDNIFADSLASGGVQGILDAPLLLNPVHTLAERTKVSLKRLNPKQVIILGGKAAISLETEEAIKALGFQVRRISGASRVETAIELAKAYAPQATHAVLARAYDANGGSSSQAFADTLGGGVLAARQGRPVLLTPSSGLSPSLRAYVSSSKITHITVLGAHDAISETVEHELNALGITVNRLSGDNRDQTAVKIAQSMGYWHAGESQSVLVVNGEDDMAWTDAFPAALYAKRYHLPVMLSATGSILPESARWIAPGLQRFPQVQVVCGYSVGDIQQCAYSPGKVSFTD